MTPEEKNQKIKELQLKKEIIHKTLITAQKVSDDLQQKYCKARENFIEIKKNYESLDREEKLLFFSMREKLPPKEPNKRIRRTPNKENAKIQAMKALKSLSKEERERILKTFK